PALSPAAESLNHARVILEPMDSKFAADFAAEWIAAWNAHDLQRVLAHYTEDFEMASPKIIQIAQEPSGRLVGKAAVGAYWATALARMPDLHFELLAVMLGVDSIVLHYRRTGGQLAAEVFYFDSNGLVFRACANYHA
ncbi:MAG: nuclear transport factor 2 family protein, partial [Sciscionella sp.]